MGESKLRNEGESGSRHGRSPVRLPNSGFLFGTQYYRMVPMPEDWERDLGHIRHLGMDTVRFWLLWPWVEQGKGDFRLADVDRLFDLAEESGLSVILITVMDALPAWTQGRYDASVLSLDRRTKTTSFEVGYCGCWDHPELRDDGEAFLRTVAGHFKDRPNLLFWDVWNEPDKPECRCAHSRAKFVRWLRDRFSTIEDFNEFVRGVYRSWGDVDIPMSAWWTPEFLLYTEFRTWSLAEQVGWAYRIVKDVDRTHPVTTHCHCDEHPFVYRAPGDVSDVGWDDWLLRDAVDFYMTSFHEYYQGEGAYTKLQNMACVVADLETKRTITDGHYLGSGLAGGASKLGDGLLTPVRPKEQTFSLWFSVAHEARGIIFWQFRTERLLGPEGPAWGLSAFDGSDTYRSKEAARFIRALRPHEGLLATARVPPPECAILYSLSSQIIGVCQPHLDYIAGLEGVTFALWINSIPFDMARAGDDLSRYKVIFVPHALLLKKATVEALIGFVRGGGTLVIEAGTACYGDNGIYHTEIPGYGLAEASGVAEQDVIYEEESEFTVGGVTFRGSKERRIFRAREEDVVGRFADGTPAVTVHGFGEGRAVYVGTYLSLYLRASGSVETARELMDLAGAPRPVRVSPVGAVTCRVLEAENGRAVLIFNNSPTAAAAGIELPFRARDVETIYSDMSEVAIAENRLTVRMEGREVLVLRMRC
jgi:beta-galactosidase